MLYVTGNVVPGSGRPIESPTGKPGVAFDFFFELQDELEGHTQKVATWEAWLSDKAAARTIESLKILGLTEQDIYDGRLDRVTTDPVRLSYDEGENRIAFVNSGSLGKEVKGAAAASVKKALADALKMSTGFRPRAADGPSDAAPTRGYRSESDTTSGDDPHF